MLMRRRVRRLSDQKLVATACLRLLSSVPSNVEMSRMCEAGHKGRGGAGTLSQLFTIAYLIPGFCVSHTFQGGNNVL